MTNDLAHTRGGGRDVGAPRSRSPRDAVSRALPDFTEGLGKRLVMIVAGWPETGPVALTEMEASAAADISQAIRDTFRETVTQGMLGEWTALVLAGTRKPRTDLETQRFMVALSFAVEDMPAAAFCEETQRAAMRKLVFSPSVAEILEVLDPIVNGWRHTRDALTEMLIQRGQAEHAQSRDAPPVLQVAEGKFNDEGADNDQ